MVEDDYKDINPRTLQQADGSKASAAYIDDYAKMHEITVIDPQWIQCDVRNLDVRTDATFRYGCYFWLRVLFL